MLGTFDRRIRVVSGGGSAYTDFDPMPAIPATPAAAAMRRNSRRVSRMAHALLSHHLSSALRCEQGGRVIATLCLHNPGVHNLPHRHCRDRIPRTLEAPASALLPHKDCERSREIE